VHWTAKEIRVEIFESLARAGGPHFWVLIDLTALKANRCSAGGKGGVHSQAINRSHGGSTTNIYVLTSRFSRPFAIPLIGGQAADC
jgi:hypothetical protein